MEMQFVLAPSGVCAAWYRHINPLMMFGFGEGALNSPVYSQGCMVGMTS